MLEILPPENNPAVLPEQAAEGNAELLLEERNQMLDAALNHEGLLPVATLTEIPLENGARSTFIKNYRISNNHGEQVGEVGLSIPSPRAVARGEKAHLRNINALKGHGYGKATYLEVLKSLPLEVGLSDKSRFKTYVGLAQTVWCGHANKFRSG